ncbi:hypothetical protein ACE6H2_003209 [Prunus campanulata]
MKHISLAPSTELADITISVGPFRSPSSPKWPSPSRNSIHRAHHVRHLPRFPWQLPFLVATIFKPLTGFQSSILGALD